MNFNNAVFECSFGKANQIPLPTLPEIVFSGKSNVGKSSLINKLFNRKALARVSGKPGKTGTINFYGLKEARFVDLPGYGYAKVSKEEKLRWAKLVEGYFKGQTSESNVHKVIPLKREIALVIQIIDVRHAPTKNDIDMINFLKEMAQDFVVVLTKSDKLKKTQLEKNITDFKVAPETANIPFVVFSAVNGTGLQELKDIISNKVSS